MTPLFRKGAVALALAGVMATGTITAASARDWRPWAAAGAGFAAGTIVGSAMAAPRYGYGYGYAYGPGHSSYAYAPGYATSAYDSYAYAPSPSYGPTYVAPGYVYQDPGNRGCAVQGNYGGRIDYWAC